ncbi:MAG: hypothetical protein WC243_03870 [Patescibacteria group bacterium]|jgi:hypothetical protein
MQEQQDTSSTKRKMGWIKYPLMILLLVAGTIIGFFIRDVLNPDKPLVCTSSQTTPSTNLSIATTSIDPSDMWKVAKFGGLFSYEYPAGWSVAELWQDDYSKNGVIIAIDRNPINTAPRGGPLATFTITILNGNFNPDEILAERLGEFNEENYTDITKETIKADIGEVVHYKGKVAGEMLKGESMESYYFTFNLHPNEPANQQVVVATLALQDDPQLSEMLRHIVLSFKDLGQ